MSEGYESNKTFEPKWREGEKERETLHEYVVGKCKGHVYLSE